MECPFIARLDILFPSMTVSIVILSHVETVFFLGFKKCPVRLGESCFAALLEMTKKKVEHYEKRRAQKETRGW